MVSLEVQMRQPHTRIEFLVVPSLATSVILGTVFLGKCVEKISLMAIIIILMRSSNIAVVNTTFRSHVFTNGSYNSQAQLECSAAEQPCVLTRATTLAPISETIMEVNISAGCARLVDTHKHRIWKRKELVAHDIVDTDP